MALYGQNARNPIRMRRSFWSPFEAKTKYIGRGKKGHMMNYRVKNLKKTLETLKPEVVLVNAKPRNRILGNSVGLRTVKANASSCGGFRKECERYDRSIDYK